MSYTTGRVAVSQWLLPLDGTQLRFIRNVCVSHVYIQVAWQYLKGSFLFDLVTSFPVSFVEQVAAAECARAGGTAGVGGTQLRFIRNVCVSHVFACNVSVPYMIIIIGRRHTAAGHPRSQAAPVVQDCPHPQNLKGHLGGAQGDHVNACCYSPARRLRVTIAMHAFPPPLPSPPSLAHEVTM